MTLAERITKIRIDAGKTKVAFAEILNISDSLIARLENGTRELTKRTAADICEKFNVNPEWLETGEGEPYNDAKTPTIKLLKAEYNLNASDWLVSYRYPVQEYLFLEAFTDFKGNNWLAVTADL